MENMLKQLCAKASTQRNRRELNSVLEELREFLQQHTEALRSMSVDTYDALHKVWRHVGARRSMVCSLAGIPHQR